MYKGLIAWQWSNTLGAGNRVCLPPCWERKVRKLFPNPVCGEGCDYSCTRDGVCEKGALHGLPHGGGVVRNPRGAVRRCLGVSVRTNLEYN